MQLQQGDETAFRKLVDEWQDMVYNTVAGIVQHEDDADDITQEVFIQVYRSIHHFKGESKLSTWLYRIASNACLKKHRRGVFDPTPEQELSQPDELDVVI